MESQSIQPRPPRIPAARTAASGRPSPERTIARPPAASAAEQLDVAQQWADRGNLPAAAEVCADILKTDRSNARVYFLLGLVREAEGQLAQAMEHFSRAVYLQADFYEAILHLSLLKARCGDQRNAEMLRLRAARLYQQNQNHP